MRYTAKLFLTLGLTLASTAAWACTNPAGATGDVKYITNYNVMAYCDGSDWVAMLGTIGGSGSGATLLNELDDVSTGGAADGQALVFNSGSWAPASVQDSRIGTLTNGQWCTSDGSNINCNTAPPLTSASSINDLTDVDTSGAASGSILAYNGSNWVISTTTAGGSDNLGNHTASQTLNLNGNWLSGDGDAEGLQVLADGTVSASGIVSATAFVGDGSSLTGINAVSSLASLTDVSLTAPASNALLRYNSGTGRWEDVELQDGISGTSMVPGYPDAILCTDSINQFLLYQVHERSTSDRVYRMPWNTSGDWSVEFDVNGDYVTHGADVSTTDCVGASIADLYADGRAYNFIGGGNVWTQAGNVAHYMVGNVGIGTSSPNALLHTHSPSSNALTIGTAGDGTSDQSILNLLTSSNGTNGIGSSGASGWHIYARGSSFTGDTNNLGITYWNGSSFLPNPVIAFEHNTGNVGIGTSSPQAKFEVREEGALDDVMLKLSASGGRALSILHPDPANINSPFTFLTPNAYNFRVDTIDALTIDSGGKVGICDNTPDYKLDVEGTAYATGAAGALSDRRHKKAITDLPVKGLATITKLRPVQFEWKDPQDAGMEGAQFGFIAQEVEEVLPQVILTQDDEEQTKGMKPTALIPVLTKAIQELRKEKNAEIKALKARNESLSKKLAAQNVRLEALEAAVRQ